MNNVNEYVGEVKDNNFGTPMKIINARKQSDIDVQFLDKHGIIKEHTTYNNFKLGQVKNPYDRTIYGVGYLGLGMYKSKTKSGKHITSYETWRTMIMRCYDEGAEKRFPAYYGKITVCEEWHNYQSFARWYEDNFYSIGDGRMHLDKDILNQGNKMYSPENCIFVPQRINEIFHIAARKKSDGLPVGIRIYAPNGKYIASYDGKSVGTYKTVEEAIDAYLKAKKNKILRVAEEYKDVIPKKLYEALLVYKVEVE